MKSYKGNQNASVPTIFKNWRSYNRICSCTLTSTFFCWGIPGSGHFANYCSHANYGTWEMNAAPNSLLDKSPSEKYFMFELFLKILNKSFSCGFYA